MISKHAFLLWVDVSRQELSLWVGGERICTYPVSTSRYGLGGEEGSFKTPPGRHRIVRWIGAGRPPGAVFVSRRFTGRVVPPGEWCDENGPDLILTRILRLRGLERGVNAGPGCDSYKRYIYIHGTNHEEALGRPASKGCIRMGNLDIIDLFDRTRGHPTLCIIERGAPPLARPSLDFGDF